MILMIEDVLITFFATLAIWLLFLGLGVLWVIDGKIKKEQVAHALFACLFAWLTALIIKNIFPTVRPFVLNGMETGVIINPTSGAFPSEHSVLAFALAVTVFLHDRKTGWFFLVMAIIIGAARVLANVHYPIDIVGGAFLGTFSAVLVGKTHFVDLMKPLKTNGGVSSPGLRRERNPSEAKTLRSSAKLHSGYSRRGINQFSKKRRH